MHSGGTNTLIGAGAAVALVLIVAAVWVADLSTPTQLVITGVLILIAVGALAAARPRQGAALPPQEADAPQRERMQRRVP